MHEGRAFHVWLLVGAIVAVTLSFIASLAFDERTLRSTERRAENIATNGTPSLVALESASYELHCLDAQVRDAIRYGGASPESRDEIVHRRRQLEARLNEYFALPIDPGESATWPEIHDGLRRIDGVLTAILGPKMPDSALRDTFDIAGDELDGAIRQASRFNAEQVQTLAAEIREIQSKATRVGIALDALSAATAIGALLLVWRSALHFRRVVGENAQLLEERATELEQFSARIAHDVLSPLMTASLAISIAQRAQPGSLDDMTRAVLARGDASIRRVRRLVDGLLEFARAGGKPLPGVHCDIREVLDDVVAEARAVAEDAHAEISVVGFTSVEVACSQGVLTSLLSNLVYNAIKAVVGRPMRRVTVRVLPSIASVRFEVADTGPGVAPEIQAVLFQPFARPKNDDYAPGRRLGLGTVKRLAEAYGGAVGFRSEPGEGSVFWFDLPRAGATTQETNP